MVWGAVGIHNSRGRPGDLVQGMARYRETKLMVKWTKDFMMI